MNISRRPLSRRGATVKVPATAAPPTTERRGYAYGDPKHLSTLPPLFFLPWVTVASLTFPTPISHVASRPTKRWPRRRQPSLRAVAIAVVIVAASSLAVTARTGTDLSDKRAVALCRENGGHSLNVPAGLLTALIFRTNLSELELGRPNPARTADSAILVPGV